MEHFRKLHDDVKQERLGQIKMVRAWAHFACWSHLIDQILWNMGLPEWVSVLGNPTEKGNWPASCACSGPTASMARSTARTSGAEEYLLSLTILGDKAYAEARGIDGWYRRAKANTWAQKVEELWQADKKEAEMTASFVRMADGVVKAMQANQPFPADGNAAWNELLFEAAIHRSATKGGARVYLPEMEGRCSADTPTTPSPCAGCEDRRRVCTSGARCAWEGASVFRRPPRRSARFGDGRYRARPTPARSRPLPLR